MYSCLCISMVRRASKAFIRLLKGYRTSKWFKNTDFKSNMISKLKSLECNYAKHTGSRTQETRKLLKSIWNSKCALNILYRLYKYTICLLTIVFRFQIYGNALVNNIQIYNALFYQCMFSQSIINNSEHLLSI